MLKRIFSYFGYAIIEQSKLKQLETSLVVALREHQDAFSPPKLKPEISFREFEETHGMTVEGRTSWNAYWKKYYEPYYQAYYLRVLSRHPQLVQPFLISFSEFDWKGTADYMKSVNWQWSDNAISPTISDLQDCVLSLLESILTDFDPAEPSTCESGGFKVTISVENEEWRAKIDFDKTGHLI